jgi:hypothetical protein
MPETESYFTTGGLQPISSSWRQAHWDPRPVFFLLNTCCYSPYVTSSLTRGWVCRLQLLLAIASAVIHGSGSCGTHHILLSQIRDSRNLEGQVPVLTSPRSSVAQLVPPRTFCLYIQRDIHAKPLCDPISEFSCPRSTRWFKYDRDWFVCKQAALSPGHIWTTLYTNDIHM